MRVGIDYRPALLLRSGIGRYVARLAEALVDLEDGPDLALFAVFRREHAARLARARMPASSRASLAAAAIPSRLLDAAARVAPVGVATFTGPIDLFHFTDYVAPPVRRAPSVFTLHDLGFLTPGFHEPASAARLARVTKELVARSAVVLVPSETTRAAAITHYRLDPARVVTTPLGVAIDDALAGDREERAGLAVASGARSGHASPEGAGEGAGAAPRPPSSQAAPPVVLALGTLEPRKNHARLLRAFERVLESGREARLVLAGRRGWLCDEVFALLGRPRLARAARWHGEVGEAELRTLMRRADVVAYPSLLEGFGLPVLEAMAAGAAVLTSDRGATREVAGDAALLVDPQSEESIASGLARLLDDAALRVELGRRGRARAAAFTWRRCAELTLAGYRRALEL